jgi:hypothetical protein
MANVIKIKRGLFENIPALAIGELAYCTDTNDLFIGAIVDLEEQTLENVKINNLEALNNFYTKSEIEGLAGLGLVWNNSNDQFDVVIADTAEAEAGTASDKLMTPERTAEAIAFQTSALLTSGDIIRATQQEAEVGQDNEALMTPLRTKQAIDIFASAVTISTTAPTNPKEGDLW